MDASELTGWQPTLNEMQIREAFPRRGYNFFTLEMNRETANHRVRSNPRFVILFAGRGG
jgi:hypothetical protein